MLKQISMMEAGVIRGLLVAIVGVLGLVLRLFGVDVDAFSDKAEQFIDALMALLAAGGLFYAGYSRVTKPTPPISDEATQKTAAMLRKQGGHVSPALLATLVLTMLGALALAGCATTERAEGFADGAAVTELQLNSLIGATTNALKAGAIAPEDAREVRELATSASDTLGLAEEAYAAGDLSTATRRYKLARGVLRELQNRLDVKPE